MIPRPQGFALITVALVLLVTASVALLLTTDVGMGQRLLTTDKERAELQYITEAGLAHAQWQLAQNTTCASYAPLPATDFGAHSYNASFDPDSSSPVSISLTGKHASGVLHTVTLPESKVYEAPITVPLQLGTDPGKDTIIDSFWDNANWGGTTSVSIYAVGSLTRTLLEFELSAIPGGVHIASAELELKQTSVGTPGVIGVHRMTRSWEEGTGLGTGNPDGATWIEHDGVGTWTATGGDFDATLYGSASVSGATTGQWVTWNIRELVQDWVSGEFPNHGLMLLGDGVVDGATFSSQEGTNPANAPKLTINYACECGAGASGTLDLQPGTIGEDTYIDDATPTTNYGADVELRISEKTNIKKHGLMRFDVSSLPPVANVVSAVLTLNLEGIGSGGTATVFLHEATSPWLEYQATWNDAQTGAPWSTAGGDYDSTPVTSAGIDAALPGPTNFAITNLVQGWVDDPSTNHGFVLVGSDGVNHADFTTGDSADPTLHPKLSISYTCPCGAGCGAGPTPPAGDQLLLVVADPAAPTTQESDKQALIESWGYTVNLIDDSDTQANFDTKFAANDVIYVGEDITSSELATKLFNATIGVVNEDGDQVDELGFGQGVLFKNRDQIDIVDNTHYITQPFPTGLLTYLSSQQSVHMLSGTDAPELLTLGQALNTGTLWKPSLAVLEQGAQIYGGGTAAGRRAQLPWGGGTFDINALNDSGRIIMERAIEWGAGAATTPPEVVLMVAQDPNALTASEAFTKSLMESWAYSVDLIDDSASQADFDAAITTANAVLITTEVDDGQLSTKLTDATIGIVTEEQRSWNELEICGDNSVGTASTDVEIADNAHYITSPFALGPLTIFTEPVETMLCSVTPADGLVPLAKAIPGSDPSIGTLETGALRMDSQPSSGRRVTTAWGGNNWDATTLTSSGQELLRRSLKWAMGYGGGGGGGGGPAASGPVFEEFTDAVLSSNAHSLTIDKPPATATGDLLIAAVATDGDNTSSLAPPAGWNAINLAHHGGKVTLGAWWKLAGAAEASSYTFNWSNSEHAYGWIMRVTGHDPVTPINADSIDTGNLANPLSPSVTTTVNDALILRLGGFDGNNVTPGDPGLSGHDAINMKDTGNGAHVASGGSGYILQPAAGGSGTSNFLLTASQEYVAITIAIAPE